MIRQQSNQEGNLMGKFARIGAGLAGFGAILSAFSYFVLGSVPLTALGLAFCILGCVVLIFPEYLVPHQLVKGMISGATANIEATLEEFAATQKAVYLPPKEGKVYIFVPLSNNPSYPEFSKIADTPKRIISNIDGHSGLFIYPPGSDVVVLSGVAGERETKIEEEKENKDFFLNDFLPQLENAISYLLVDFSEFCSKVQIGFKENRAILRMRNVKLNIEVPRFTKVLGSLPASLAACAIAQITRTPVKIIEEKQEGKWVRVVFEVGV